MLGTERRSSPRGSAAARPGAPGLSTNGIQHMGRRAQLPLGGARRAPPLRRGRRGCPHRQGVRSGPGDPPASGESRRPKRGQRRRPCRTRPYRAGDPSVHARRSRGVRRTPDRAEAQCHAFEAGTLGDRSTAAAPGNRCASPEPDSDERPSCHATTGMRKRHRVDSHSRTPAIHMRMGAQPIVR